MSFIWYDIVLLVIFITFVSLFLYFKRKKIKKDGLLLLYRTPWGIKLINHIGKKYKKTMKAISWLSIISGYALMVAMIYLLYKIINVYIFNQNIVRAIKVPPIMPLVPYIDKIVPGLPEFYFIYWILIIMIIAIPHEFSHGIIAAYNKIKIKTTGFGFFPSFLPIFLAAFVELDEKAMAKKEKFKQMAILAAGTFANVVFAVIFLLLLWLTFPILFASSGVVFDSYQMSIIDVNNVSFVNGEEISILSYNLLTEKVNETGLTKVIAFNKTYFLNKELVSKKGYEEALEQGYLIVYYDSPAIHANLSGAIFEINGVKVKNVEELQNALNQYSPGDKITVSSILNDSEKNYEIILKENPKDSTKPWLGVQIVSTEETPTAEFFSKITGFRKANVLYKGRFGEFSNFIYDLLWWTALICISVALVNMLPVGIFDGGRFFYLTILAITKSEKIAKKSFAAVTYLFLLLVLMLMVLWVKSFL